MPRIVDTYRMKDEPKKIVQETEQAKRSAEDAATRPCDTNAEDELAEYIYDCGCYFMENSYIQPDVLEFDIPSDWLCVADQSVVVPYDTAAPQPDLRAGAMAELEAWENELLLAEYNRCDVMAFENWP